MPTLPFKLNHDRRHHIPRQRRKVVNWRDYDAQGNRVNWVVLSLPELT
jgi:hypothetical protein